MRVLVVDDEPAFSEPLAERLALRGYDTATAQDADAALAELARSNLHRAGVVNVFVETGDAVQGWSAKAPYDAIVLSGSTPRLSDTLLRQLKVGGRLIAVVGEAPVMVMQLVTRTGEDSFTTANVLETLLAPLLNAPKRSKFVF